MTKAALLRCDFTNISHKFSRFDFSTFDILLPIAYNEDEPRSLAPTIMFRQMERKMYK